ncbi:hypothetical protein HYPDE_31298 [Hyphomicrobium denitrificans 1NES1]|uniref:Tetrahydromethanopterin synthesis protein n=1 Tax=Hyphomicrobium denitrificans 1NES1 TaxID=670307 RepID=N0B342_9HYPH|nr:DUF447 domain-containing protein [Hyphomicrobium denitrificans]AGK57934.1 hypothetical protein HYPDE_31298 [Hyphomicrobium denitrificans 1NES1]
MPRIVETIVTTVSASDEPYIAPLGLIEDGSHWIIAPFKPSRTLENLRVHPFAVASHTDDVRVFAGGVTGRKLWPLEATKKVKGHRLADCVSHWEMKVERFFEDEQRPRFACTIVHRQTHKPWEGFNRAQAAVLELAVLTTRLNMLPPEKIESELKYLEIAISKTAGSREEEAWGWLMEKINAWRQARFDKSADAP